MSKGCEHVKNKFFCKPCGGNGICEHGVRKYRCVPCKGKGVCEHGKQKYFCRPCKGKSFCKHEKSKYYCKLCKGKGICKHDIQKRLCQECKYIKDLKCRYGKNCVFCIQGDIACTFHGKHDCGMCAFKAKSERLAITLRYQDGHLRPW